MSFAQEKAHTIASAMGLTTAHDLLYDGKGEGRLYHEADTVDAEQMTVVDLGNKTREFKMVKAWYLHGQAFSKPKMDMLRVAFGDLAINKLASLRSRGEVSNEKLMEQLTMPTPVRRTVVVTWGSGMLTNCVMCASC